MPPPCGALTAKHIKDGNVQRRAARWVSNSYSYYDRISAMLSNLGWRSLEYRRYNSRLAMFYQIQYGLVAVSMPSLAIPLISTRYMFLLTIIGSRVVFFPMTVVLWNRLPAGLVVL